MLNLVCSFIVLFILHCFSYLHKFCDQINYNIYILALIGKVVNHGSCVWPQLGNKCRLGNHITVKFGNHNMYNFCNILFMYFVFLHLVTQECRNDPCLNGATCVDIFMGYVCLCSPGWRGLHCDIGKITWSHMHV